MLRCHYLELEDVNVNYSDGKGVLLKSHINDDLEDDEVL